MKIKEAINIFFKYPFGIGNHQIKIEAANINLIPINNIGGKDSNAGLAITNQSLKKLVLEMQLEYLLNS